MGLLQSSVFSSELSVDMVTARSSAACKQGSAGATCAGHVKVTVVNGFGMSRPSQERSCQARCGMRVESTEPACAGELGELYRPALRNTRGTTRAVGCKRADTAFGRSLRHATQGGRAAAAAGSAHRDEAEMLGSARNQFAVERL